jgi:hypothetical protein
LSFQNLLSRNTAHSFSSYCVKKLDDKQAEDLLDDPNITLALKSKLNVISCRQNTVNEIVTTVLQQSRIRTEFEQLLSVSGISEKLGLTFLFTGNG